MRSWCLLARHGGQIAGAEVSPLRKARIGDRVRAAVDTAEGGSRDPVLRPEAAETALGHVEAKP